jgi:hypothetical protein
MADIISFDIETIPQQAPLSISQQEEYDKRIKAILKKNFPDGNYTEEDFAKMRGLVMATTPYLGEIVCIGLYRNTGSVDGEKAIVGDEKEMLINFWKQIADFGGSFVSFNGLDFDVPFIIKRSMFHKILPTNNNFVNLKRFSTWPHFDVKYVMGDYDKYASGSLKLVCEYLGVPSPKEGEIKADQVEQAFYDGKIKEISEYCLRDVVSTYKCYEIIKKYTFNPQIK